MRYLILLISLLLECLAFGQTFEFVFKQLDIYDGLSQNSVMSIHQDHQGFIWMGTYDGLNKYDGIKIKTYLAQNNNPFTITNNSVYDICRDYKNNLCISTDGGGVNIYDPLTEQFKVLANDSSSNAILSNNVIRLCACSDSTIWISTHEGISVYNSKKGTTKNYPINMSEPNGFPNFEPRRIIEDGNNTIWIGTNGGGLIKYLPEKDGFQTFYNWANGDDLFDYNIIITLSEISDSVLLVGTLKGAFLFNKNTATYSKYLEINDEVIAALIDSEGTIWIGTANEGLYYKKKNQTLRQLQHNPNNAKSLPENHIKSLHEDNNKNIWIGFMGNGVAWLSLTQKEFYHMYKIPGVNSLVDNNIFSIEEDHDKNVWIGTTKGVSVWDRKHNSFKNITTKTKNSITSDRIWEIFYDKENHIWLGGLNGVDVYDIKARTFKNFKFVYNDSTSLPNNAVYAIAKDKNNDIWLGTFSGIARFNKSNQTFKNYISNETQTCLSNNLVWDIMSDSKGRLWVATLNGLNKYNFDTDTFSEIVLKNCKNSINNCELTYLSEDSDGNIWISSRTGLINYNPDSKEIKEITVAQGLPSNTVLGVVEHNNDIWITSKGISKIDKETLIPINYGITDGLQSNEFNVATKKLHDGLIMFGGINGINAFYPNRIKSTQYTPQIRFTNLELNGTKIIPHLVRYGKIPITKSITYAESINLSYKEKLVHIEFVAIDMSAAEKIKYAYRLMPNTEEWIPLGTNNSVTFSNLSPDEYVLEVKSTNSEQVLCNNTISLRIIITPPFWKQTWFYVLEILILLVLIFLYNYVRNRMIKETNRRLELTVSERTEEIISQKEEIEAQRNMANEQRDKIVDQKEKLEKFNEALEEKVQQRTLELNKAKDRAEESDRLKSAFLSNMSHEIRTPLNAIIGFSDILLVNELETYEKHQYLELIKNNGRTLLHLLNDIIDISMIESGQLYICPGKVNLYSVVNTIYLTFKNNFIKNRTGVKMVFLPDENLNYEIVTDSLRLIQIMNNLLNNAVKYTVEGTITISYSIHHESIHFIVSDTGIGLEETDVDKIFNRFHKVENFKSKAYRGGGLGLAISKNLAEALGGIIWVKSQLGKGSEFHFTISTNLLVE